MGVLHIFGYVTFYFGYCIGYYIDVLLFVARTPDPRNELLLGDRRGPRGAASPIPPTNRFRGTNSTCDVIYRLMFAPRATGRGLQAPA